MRSASTSCRSWEELCRSRRQPGKTGRTRGTERTGRASAHPALTQAPPERGPDRQVPGRTDQQISPRTRRCRPLALVLTAGQVADSPQFIPVLKRVRVRLPVGRPRTTPGAVAADKAYSSRGNRSYLSTRNIKADIPEKRDRAANRKKKGARTAGPSATMPTSTRNGTPSSA
ncbi:transposase [Streptomyces sp. NPDC006514]|uniref:transposase n=1 Tax=Streptomyces sp. NPDC006514 TaxID=3154308 RepID=UPI0033A87AD4